MDEIHGLYAEIETVDGMRYFQCERHWRMSLNATSGHILRIAIPPVHAMSSSACDGCVIRALEGIGALRIDASDA